jgi:hypothetical protein
VLAAARFDGVPPRLEPEYLNLALGNLHTNDSPGFRALPSIRATANERAVEAA